MYYWSHAKFTLSSEEAEALVCIFDGTNMAGLGQIVGDMYTEELEAVKHLHFNIIDTDWSMYSILLYEVDDQLLCFVFYS